MNITRDRVRQQIVNILRVWGMADDLVNTTADAMVETDLLGVDSHGISMLMAYEQRKLEGRLNMHAKPTIIHETPAMDPSRPVLVAGDPEAGQFLPLAITFLFRHVGS